ncbi:MAG: glycerophosphoryl diester phosphodiesterase membrane domain-containing protein [Tannerellaceae bacterium]|jgi:uncharacterized membrane protein|nr:glycerophosphoryl diester phosphodiesterase membrane domain-containing protein [Tannerellaceae bacterium]
MESRFTISNVLSVSWKALASQIWILAGLMIGYIILSLILSLVLPPLFSSPMTGTIVSQLASVVFALIFNLGYLKNLFQALDGDEPRLSAYGQQARKIGVYFVAALLQGIAVSIIVTLFLAPYFYWLFQNSFISEIALDVNGLPLIPEGHGAALCGILLGTLVLLLPAIYVAIRLMFYQAFIIEEDAGIIESLKKSWQITKGQELPLFLLALVWLGLFIAGFLLFLIGLFVAYPLMLMMYCYTFRQLNRNR